MCSRKTLFLTFLALTLLAANAPAATCWFYGGGSTAGDWDVSGNWWGGVPTSADTANLNEGGVTCVVDSSQTAVCSAIWLPDWQNGASNCVLSMTGGTITVSNNMEMGRWDTTSDTGELNISGGTITIGGQLHVGAKNASASVGGEGIINMTGGTIDVASTLQVPRATGLGSVYLDGGTIEAGGITMDANGLIDITAGTLIIDGDVESTINGYVTNGYITAYDGEGEVDVDYNITHAGQTTVTGSEGGPPPLGKATNPSPANSATNVDVDADLSWTADAGADSHNVYFGTSSSAVDNATTSSGEFQGNQGGTTYNPGTMSYSSTYYWRIDEVNSPNTTKGDIWNFTTEAAPAVPGQATSPSPANSATDVGINDDLSWTAGPNTSSHDVYFGTSSSAVDNATTSSSEFKGNQGGTSYDPGTLSVSTTYYWRIDEVNDTSSNTTKGNVWSFTTEAEVTLGKATNPLPADTSKGMPTSTDLAWTADAAADSHNVYFGTSSAAVDSATTSSSEFQSNQGGTTYALSTLSNGTNYYWRIDEVNSPDTTKGDVWTFRTELSGGQQVWFYIPSAATGRWDTDAQWTPHHPNSVDTANINKSGKTCIIDSATTGTCKRIWLPDWQDGAQACVLSISGGTLAVDGNTILGRYGGDGADPYDIGTINISGGTVTIGNELSIGYKRSDRTTGGQGIINMTGGSIDVAGPLKIPNGNATGGVNLTGGTLEAGSISMTTNGLLDIAGGTLIIDGNVVSTIASYVSSGYVTAYDGNGIINSDYNVSNAGKTTVTATLPTPTKATNPSPANSATNIDVNDDLSWSAGTGTASHNVYLGTAFADVNTATTSSSEFKGNQGGTTYDPGTLAYESTYYWRIDEVNSPNTAKGDVWDFTTAASSSVPPISQWYVGNIHYHSTNSDGSDSVATMVTTSRDTGGYDFSCITDHDYISDANQYTTSTFLGINGVEATAGGPHVIGIGMTSTGVFDPCWSLQGHINNIVADGGLPMVAHPNSSSAGNDMYTLMANMTDCNHISVCDWYGSNGNSEPWWDALLSDGKIIYGHAAEDAHAASILGYTYNVVGATELTLKAVRTALENGDYYFCYTPTKWATGIAISSYAVTGTDANDTISISTDYGDTIRFIGNNGSVLQTTYSNEASYTIGGTEVYVRTKITNSDGDITWTQPVCGIGN